MLTLAAAALRYHKACGDAGVKDPTKMLDRDRVLSHFLGGEGDLTNVVVNEGGVGEEEEEG